MAKYFSSERMHGIIMTCEVITPPAARDRLRTGSGLMDRAGFEPAAIAFLVMFHCKGNTLPLSYRPSRVKLRENMYWYLVPDYKSRILRR